MAATQQMDEETFVEEPQDDLRCPICLHVLDDPFQTSCGHRFCYDCILPVRNSPNPICPIDRLSVADGVFPDNAAKMQIRRLKVYCTHRKQGCQWVGDLCDKPAHLLHCEHGSRKCPYCTDFFKVTEIQEHITNCPCRPVDCEYCEERMPYDKLREHLEACPQMPLPCPVGCSSVSIPRCQLQEHVMGDCPRQLTSCPMEPFGCSEKIARGDLDAHMRECAINSIRKLAEMVIEQKKEIEVLKQALESHTDILKEMESTSYSAYGKFTWKVESLREKVALAEKYPDGKHAVLYSPPFFTSEGGYKLCLCIYPAGDNNQGCLSLYFVVMKGPFDEILPWPFQKRVSMILVNARGGAHIVKDFVPDPRLHYFKRPKELRNVGFGYPKFIPLVNLLKDDSDFVANNAIFVRAVIY